ncbi:unnamed protein product [marine sediment metagenome]|uniref:Uncharacterized protein n=1 Tax=marine sediment metagenome TaxID=412755 RepID=X0UY61_9ZZZZ
MSKNGYILYEVSRGNIKTIIRKAFKDGQDWAKVYISWFDPSEEDHEAKMKKTTTRILRAISKLKKESDK